MKKTVIYLCVIFIVTGCNSRKGEGLPGGKGADSSVPVEAILVKKQLYTNIIEVNGTVGVKGKVNITSPREELIKTINYEEADYVKKGSVLFILDTITLEISKEQLTAEKLEAEQNLRMAEARYAEALLAVEKNMLNLEKFRTEIELKELNFSNTTRELLKKKKLFEIGDLPREELINFQSKTYINEKKQLDISYKELEIRLIGFRDEDITSAGYQLPPAAGERHKLLKLVNTRTEAAAVEGAKMRLRNARSRIKSLDEQLRLSVVRSPINGYIAARGYDIGEKVTRTDPVFIIVDISKVFIEAELPEVRYPELNLGDKLHFWIEQDTRRILKTRVSIISPVVNEETGSFKIKGVYNNYQKRLKPGMFTYIRIISRNKSRIIRVPAEYIHDIDNKNGTVYILKDEKAAGTKVTLGKQRDNLYHVLGGLRPGDTIVHSSSTPLYDGVAVNINRDEKKKQEKGAHGK